MIKKLLCGLTLLYAATTCATGNFFLYPNVLLQTVTSNDSNYRGVSPKLAVGYGAILGQSFYLAGEASAAIGTAQISSNISTNGINARINKTYDFSLLPGMFFSDNALVFVKLGAASSNFSTPNKYATGGELGLGLQFSILNCWHVRGEYFYTSYSSIEGIKNPVSDTFALGAVFTFN
ncbi:hypothetical protein N9L02_00575 [Gammaproteobacteria bacterium]|nr:hypothetical protein [Gammaproteobacteria bacterium]